MLSEKIYIGKLRNKNLFTKSEEIDVINVVIQMAKRKNDCDLDDVISAYLKKKKYCRSLKLFDAKNGNKGDASSAVLSKFEKFLKKQNQKSKNLDDLDFEINFGAFQPTQKVIFLWFQKFLSRGHYT